MKGTKIVALTVAVIMLSLCALAPSADAATKDVEATGYVHKSFTEPDSSMFSPVFTQKVSLKAGAQLSSSDYCYIYTEEEYDKWNTDGSGTYFSIVNTGEKLCDVTDTYGIVSRGASFVTVNGTDITTMTLDRGDLFMESYTGLKDTRSTVHIDFGPYAGSVYAMVLRSTGSMMVKNVGAVDMYNDSSMQGFIVAKAIASSGGSVDLSFTCPNTDIYWVAIGFTNEQSVSYHMTINGVAEFTDSNALSIAMIVIALALLIGLLYVSNKKLIK